MVTDKGAVLYCPAPDAPAWKREHGPAEWQGKQETPTLGGAWGFRGLLGEA